ncbi:hypothetical protein HMPREF1411_01417 [Helicobacter pylori GAM250AFi]|nr:hypothetical protein HMPREF1411_01417 [Helicobacter pylori GAM250AFi]EMH12186.1 hypothetical protein HMPREF1413_01636 [Helicobacter pylori GAM252Bi]EMH12391.1 hypothetical protein HMPREF1414_01560 [Helicobacter pylori GAM252T]EMH14369.1 hypothetical protein HMPREF1412_00688 [Helicobacter pylori GAM250T]EMH47482.1 hypothetical protein HMPREF1438_01008 [Helicobacter pylori HP250AFii]EMH49877.1 hypothetical protein HMPREF1440_01584 [Helicobacter pylori HP250AFiV]EMH50305.1 hypothetical protei
MNFLKLDFTLMLSKIHSIVRLKNLKGDGLKVFLMVAFKPFKKGLGVYFQKGFVFLCFHISIRSLKWINKR